MKTTLLHRISGILLTLAILFPIGVQAMHAIEKHEHKVCNAVDTKHYHSIEVDCCICHFQVKHDTFQILPEFEIAEHTTFNHVVFGESSGEFILYVNQKSSRAPPYFFFA